MKRLEEARNLLKWASNRLTAAHRDTQQLTDKEFEEDLICYLMATRNYHEAIREANKEIHAS